MLGGKGGGEYLEGLDREEYYQNICEFKNCFK